MGPDSVHFDDQGLEVLVFGDEDSAEYQAVAVHVEACQQCRARLNELTGSDSVLQDVSGLLSGYPRQELLNGEDLRFPTAEVATSLNLDFLEKPTHPEMLGRLGKYEIERLIGSGGMGIVFRGFDTELNRPVAIKVLAQHLAHNGAARKRFARESRAAAAVVHEHVVAIYSVETAVEIPFLVMQYIPGESLQARVDKNGPLTAKEVLRIGIQAAAGLAAAHEQGVIHRDIKPGNILLESGVERALVADFGLARTVDDASLTHTGVVAGTPHYMSPEQAAGASSDHRSDLFSLGSVLYFMATGRPPFRAERAVGVLKRICHDRHRPVWEVNPDTPDRLSAVIDRLLQKQARRRYSSAAQVKQALTETLADTQQRVGQRSRLRRCLWSYRRAITVAAASTVVLGLLALFLTLGMRYGPSPNTRADSPEMTVAAQGTETQDLLLPSIDVIQHASPREAEEYSAQIDSLVRRIEKLETEAEDTTFATADDATWEAEFNSISLQLELLRGRKRP